jgi:small ligand-binding sensory domain FIST
VPHLSSLCSAHVRKSGVFEDAAVEERHDVEGGADDRVVFAEAESLRDGHVGVLESVQDAVLAVDLVGCLGEELSWGLLAHDILLAICGSQQVCWIALAIAELLLACQWC